ncbi:molybdenum cofactor biosynthesis protein MoeA [Hymenobacter sp. HMF4947]|uniref:Molybdenum cofactor biosynthesis protein MoeA n=1 Tax=Hymenobacter ginkgonis TaxID=2682976 RepID=A0A7K1TEC3_9BACT|nr:SMI1/KNR4 family protein [Hymenobacter ginkgonis]MVN76747.1 molybdenum cofactor biosynthesis protein MoeA [Hymenobacter ginkgonis]
MQSIWERLEAWLHAYAPQLTTELNPGATDAELQQLAATIGTELPADFLAFYCIHNGQRNDAGGLLNGEELLSVPRMLTEWTIWNDLLKGGDFEGATSTPAPGVRTEWWHPHWLPLTYDGAGNHCCLDLSPAPGGTRGQIIRMWHDDAERTLLAPSFADWITQYVAALEAGEYVFSADYGGLVSVDEVDE